jgi:uncharacterized protein YeeX (DUF496 family)
MRYVNRTLLRKIILLLAPIAALFLATPGGIAQKKQDDTRSVMTWEHSDDGWRQRLEIRGKAEFDTEYTDIKEVSEGGVVRIEEVRNGQSRRYEVRRDVGGQLTRAFYVNGETRALDAAARSWVAQMVLNAVRQGGIDADKRVQTILSRSGVQGVLQEIDQIKSDYAKRHYFEALLRHGKLDEKTLQSTLAQAARQISSDYEQAQLLLGVAPVLTGKDAATPAFFQAVASIDSDYERSRVLKTLLKRVEPSKELLTQIATATKEIDSDYEKAGVLKAVAAVYLDDAALRGVFFQTVNTISSDYEHRRVLSALIKAKNLGEEVLTQVLDSTAGISSDYEKATLLLEISSIYSRDSRLRSAFLKAVETIKSDYERGRVLSAMLKNKQIG